MVHNNSIHTTLNVIGFVEHIIEYYLMHSHIILFIAIGYLQHYLSACTSLVLWFVLCNLVKREFLIKIKNDLNARLGLNGIERSGFFGNGGGEQRRRFRPRAREFARQDRQWRLALQRRAVCRRRAQ